MTDMRMNENLFKWEKIRQRFRRSKKTQATVSEELFSNLFIPKPQTSNHHRHQLDRSEPQPLSHPRPPTRRDVHRPLSSLQHLQPLNPLASEPPAADSTREYYLSINTGPARRPRSQTVSGPWTTDELEEELLRPASPSSPPASLSPLQLAASGYVYKAPSSSHPQLLAAESVYENYVSNPIPGYGRQRAQTEFAIRWDKEEAKDGADDDADDDANEADEEEQSTSPASSTPSPLFALSRSPSPPPFPPLLEPAPPFEEVLQAQSRNYRWTQNFALLQGPQWSEEAKEQLQQVGTSETVPEEELSDTSETILVFFTDNSAQIGHPSSFF
ncbi:hypothetical protein BDZ45DRAFT_696451 [Acephala macrosclerotiorum]|nr:hypothetical protein BDZ45DRAFT_696451 [Acephala macrosclerotiorum]